MFVRLFTFAWRMQPLCDSSVNLSLLWTDPHVQKNNSSSVTVTPNNSSSFWYTGFRVSSTDALVCACLNGLRTSLPVNGRTVQLHLLLNLKLLQTQHWVSQSLLSSILKTAAWLWWMLHESDSHCDRIVEKAARRPFKKKKSPGHMTTKNPIGAASYFLTCCSLSFSSSNLFLNISRSWNTLISSSSSFFFFIISSCAFCCLFSSIWELRAL